MPLLLLAGTFFGYVSVLCAALSLYHAASGHRDGLPGLCLYSLSAACLLAPRWMTDHLGNLVLSDQVLLIGGGCFFVALIWSSHRVEPRPPVPKLPSVPRDR